MSAVGRLCVLLKACSKKKVFVVNFQLCQKKFIQPATGISLLALLALLPFSTAATNILEGFLILFWLSGGTVKEDCRRFVSQYFAKILLILLGFAILSLLWTTVPGSVAWEGIRKFRKLIVLFVAWCFLSRNPLWRERFLWTGLISFGVLALICVGIGFEISGFPEKVPGQGAILTKSHIAQGYIMAILVVIGLEMSLRKGRLGKIILGACAALLAVGVTFFMTNGRTGYLAIVVALVAVVVSYPYKKNLKFIALVVALVVVGISAAVSTNVVNRTMEVKTDIQEFSEGNKHTSSGERLSYWTAALSILKEHPVAGIGIGGFGQFYCDTPGKTKVLKNCIRGWGSGNPHSDFLNFGAQFGLVGIFLWVAFLIVCFYTALRATTVRDRLIGMGFLFAYLAGGAVNSFMWDVTEGTLAALCFAWILSTQKRQEPAVMATTG